METKSFFGESGLTSTSANHYCNLAKEAVRSLKAYLANVRFMDTEMSVIGDDKGGKVLLGMKFEDLKKIREYIDIIAQLNSLIAFFREGIKEKERLTQEAQNYEDLEARAAWDCKAQEHQLNKPVRKIYLDEEAVLKTWTIGEQEKYLSLEAEAAAYGSYIHEDGAVSVARIALMKSLNNPITVKESGRDTLIYKNLPTVDLIAVNNIYFSLQNHYREVQAELNGMKKRIQDTIENHKTEVDEEYRLALQKWNIEQGELDRQYQELMENDSKSRTSLLQEIQKLKIVVPKRLEPIFQELQALA